jgi:hypothetical protein
MGYKLYNKPPDCIKKIESYKTFRIGTEIFSPSAYILFSGGICSSITV